MNNPSETSKPSMESGEGTAGKRASLMHVRLRWPRAERRHCPWHRSGASCTVSAAVLRAGLAQRASRPPAQRQAQEKTHSLLPTTAGSQYETRENRRPPSSLRSHLPEVADCACRPCEVGTHPVLFRHMSREWGVQAPGHSLCAALFTTGAVGAWLHGSVRVTLGTARFAPGTTPLLWQWVT